MLNVLRVNGQSAAKPTIAELENLTDMELSTLQLLLNPGVRPVIGGRNAVIQKIFRRYGEEFDKTTRSSGPDRESTEGAAVGSTLSSANSSEEAGGDHPTPRGSGHLERCRDNHQAIEDSDRDYRPGRAVTQDTPRVMEKGRGSRKVDAGTSQAHNSLFLYMSSFDTTDSTF